MPAASPVRDLYLHLVRHAAHLPAALLNVAAARAAGDETLTAALLGRPEVDTALAARLAGPPRRRSFGVWLAWLERAELTDDARCAAVRADPRVTSRRSLAGHSRTPPAVLEMLGADTDRATRLAVLGNRAAPSATRLTILAGFEDDLRRGVHKDWRAKKAELETVTNALNFSSFDDLAAEAVLQTTDARLLVALTKFRSLPYEAAAHVVEHGVAGQLARLRGARFGREVHLDPAKELTFNVLVQRKGDPERPGRPLLLARLRELWNAAPLSDAELRNAYGTLARFGIGAPASGNLTGQRLAAALAEAERSADTAGQLTDAVLVALGEDEAAWQAFDTLATQVNGSLADVLAAARGVSSPSS